MYIILSTIHDPVRVTIDVPRHRPLSARNSTGSVERCNVDNHIVGDTLSIHAHETISRTELRPLRGSSHENKILIKQVQVMLRCLRVRRVAKCAT
jgi:hypothetical protein